METSARFGAPPPVQVMHLFPEMLASLLTFLRSLTNDEWRRPTVCPEWTVKDIGLHLLAVDLGNLSLGRDEFSDPWWQVSGDDLTTSLNRWNESWVKAARRISPQLLRELLEYTGEAAIRYFANLDRSAIGPPVSWAGPGPAPVWLDVAREYTERWVHQQQMRDAVHRPGLLEPRYLAPVLATFVHALPQALRSTAAPTGTLVRLVITGEAGGQWVAARERNNWVLGKDTGGPATATGILDQDTALRLWTRSLSRDDAHERVRLGGAPELATAILEMISIIA